MLIATLRYNAIELDQVSVMFLQHLSLSDSVILLSGYIPTILVLVFRRWILGNDLSGLFIS